MRGVVINGCIRLGELGQIRNVTNESRPRLAANGDGVGEATEQRDRRDVCLDTSNTELGKERDAPPELQATSYVISLTTTLRVNCHSGAIEILLST